MQKVVRSIDRLVEFLDGVGVFGAAQCQWLIGELAELVNRVNEDLQSCLPIVHDLFSRPL